jgi:hypothetical protein
MVLPVKFQVLGWEKRILSGCSLVLHRLGDIQRARRLFFMRLGYSMPDPTKQRIAVLRQDP